MQADAPQKASKRQPKIQGNWWSLPFRSVQWRGSVAAVICTRLVHGVHPDPRAVNLDFVGIHGSVGNQDLRVLDDLRLSHPDLLVQDEATRQIVED